MYLSWSAGSGSICMCLSELCLSLLHHACLWQKVLVSGCQQAANQCACWWGVLSQPANHGPPRTLSWVLAAHVVCIYAFYWFILYSPSVTWVKIMSEVLDTSCSHKCTCNSDEEQTVVVRRERNLGHAYISHFAKQHVGTKAIGDLWSNGCFNTMSFQQYFGPFH